MNDKELADKVVALGVGEFTGEWYCAPDDYHPLIVEQFVRDWRVAGALIEKVLDAAKDRKAAWKKIDPQGNWISMTKPISVPRSIIEACCDWLIIQ